MVDRFRWFREFCANNAGLKALSLVLAVLTFLAIRGATSYEVSYQVPLEVRVEPGIAILDQDVRTVNVVLRGSQQDILALDENQLKAVLKPRVSGPSGSESVTIGPGNVEGATRGVRVVKVRPGVVNLTFDHEGQKKMAVAKPQTLGRPLAGKVEIDYEPRFVIIRGPERRLRNRSTVLTEPVDVDGRVASFTRQVKVLSPSESWVPRIDPPEVTVKVNIVTETKAQVLVGLPVQVIVPPGGAADVRLEPTTVKVVLQGRAELVEGVASNAVKVFVDCAGLDQASSYELPVSVHLPPGADDVIARVEPAQVRVTFGPKAVPGGG